MFSPYCLSMFQEIYKKGGRKFGFVNLAPLGCLPIMKEIKLQQGGTGECMEEATELAKLHNIALSKALQKLEIKLKGLKFPISNFYTLLEERMDKPSKYGMLPSSSHYVIFPVAQLHFCSNSPFVLMLLRFQGREESMLRFGSLQGPFELWREENNKRVWVMQQCKRTCVLWFSSFYRQGQPANGWVNVEGNWQCHRTLQFGSVRR